jgi:predicted transcriptional regulator
MSNHQKFELGILSALWKGKAMTRKEIMESFPAKHRPSYQQIRNTMEQLESKRAIRLAKKVGQAQLFEASAESQGDL